MTDCYLQFFKHFLLDNTKCYIIQYLDIFIKKLPIYKNTLQLIVNIVQHLIAVFHGIKYLLLLLFHCLAVNF